MSDELLSGMERAESAVPAADPSVSAGPVQPGLSPDSAPEQEGLPSDLAEAYEPFFVPDGMQVDETLSREFGSVAREIGLPQDKAQKLVDFYTTTQQRQFEALNESWIAAVKSDPDIGGARLAETLAVAAKAVDAFGGDDLRRFFDETGMGNHPSMVRLMATIGRRISEDGFIPGRAGAEPKSAAEVLYPSAR